MPKDTVKVKFKESQTVYDHNGEVETEFVAGESYDLTKASAARWVRRKVAEYASSNNSRTKSSNASNGRTRSNKRS